MKQFFTLIFVLGLLTPNFSFAASDGFDSTFFFPTNDDSEYLSVWGTTKSKKGDVFLGTTLSYGYRPLQLVQNGTRQQGILDHAVTEYFYGSFAIFDQWLSVGLNVPVVYWAKFKNPNIAGSTYQNKAALGDIRLNLKTTLLSTTDHKFGLAIIPFLGIPTGSGEEYYGYKKISGGSQIALEYQPVSSISFAVNSGLEANSEFDLRNMKRQLQFLLSGAARVNLSNYVKVVGEVQSVTRLKGLYKERVESPVEALGSVHWQIPSTPIKTHIGGGGGIVHGSSAPQYRIFGGLAYSTAQERKHDIRSEIHTIRSTQIHFAFNQIALTPNEMKKLDQVGRILSKRKDFRLQIVGETSPTGNKVYNKNLSLKRAKRVKDYLHHHFDIGVHQLQAIAHGESPSYQNKDAQKFRRVIFNVIP